MRIGAAALVVSASVLLSRLLGLGRDILLATLIGVNVEGDLYRQAFTIPDFLNYLLAGAYLTITLIPILSRHLERGDQEAASRAFTSVFRFVAMVILGLTLVMWVFADQLVSIAFPSVVEQHDRLVSLTRLVLPAQVFLVLGSLLMAVQYTHRRFVLPALAPLVYNLGIISGGLIAASLGEPSPEGFLIGAVVGSAVGNFGLQWFGARRTGTWLRPIGRADSAVREYLVLALPLMIGQSIAVLDEQFVRFFGQVEEGTTTALTLARQLNMVPIGVIAQAAGVAAFPFLARLASRGDDTGLARTTARATRITTYVAFGAAAAVFALAAPLVRFLYQYRAFTPEDTDLVASLLALYALSIPAWGIHQILSRHFYARRRMWTPVAIGTAFTVVAIPVWLSLRSAMGAEGMALASSLVMASYAAAMIVAWWRDTRSPLIRPLLGSILRGMVAATAAGLAGRQVVQLIVGDSPIGIAQSLVALAVGGLIVAVVFLLATFALRSPELRELFKPKDGDDSTQISDGRA
jgi:putative peptidoglycan lipid II flippase